MSAFEFFKVNCFNGHDVFLKELKATVFVLYTAMGVSGFAPHTIGKEAIFKILNECLFESISE